MFASVSLFMRKFIMMFMFLCSCACLDQGHSVGLKLLFQVSAIIWIWEVSGSGSVKSGRVCVRMSSPLSQLNEFVRLFVAYVQSQTIR